MSDASWTSRTIRRWSHNSFEMFESLRNHSKVRALGAVRVEAERRQMGFCHVWTVECFLQCIVTGDEKWIHCDNPMCRRLCDKPGYASTAMAKPNIHGSKLLLGNLEWLERSSLLWTAQTDWNYHYRLQCVWAGHWRKTVAVRAETRQSNFGTWQC